MNEVGDNMHICKESGLTEYEKADEILNADVGRRWELLFQTAINRRLWWEYLDHKQENKRRFADGLYWILLGEEIAQEIDVSTVKLNIS